MAELTYPFTYSFDKKEVVPWTAEEQKPSVPFSQAATNVGMFFGALGVLHGIGYLSTGQGRVYDHYHGAIHAMEEYSPFNILRTFQLSSFTSQFTSMAQSPAEITGKKLLDDPALRQYMAKLIGGGEATAARLMREGVRLSGGTLYYGSGDVALKHARLILNSPITDLVQPSAYWSAAYARSLGVADHAATWASPPLEVMFAEPTFKGYGAQIIGGHSRAQHYWRQAAAWGTEYVSRFNRLLRNPFELFGMEQAFLKFQKVARKVPGAGRLVQYGFGVRPGGGLSTMARLTGKWGFLATAAFVGWQEVDRLFRTSDTLEGTRFDEGLNVGIASLWTEGNILAAKAARATGLQDYRERQEEIAPGSTSLTKLAAFPIMGFVAGGIWGYGRRMWHTAAAHRAGMPLVEATQVGREAALGWGGSLVGRLKGLTRLPGLKEASPAKVLATAGAAVGAALVAPFLLGALVPEKTPEELEAIYSGEVEVPIRKGRWWELGRTPWEGGRIQYYAPHWYPRMRWQARQRMIWGEDFDEISEFEKFYKREFTYELEQRHYEERPYPITGTALEDIPLVGPTLAATLGQFLKPARLMHTEEWVRQGETGEAEVAPLPMRFGEEFHPELGQQPEGTPISPYAPTQVVGEQIYRMTEMIGLPGFIETAIKEKLTGGQDWFDEYRQLESARRMYGAERSYWEEEIGGGAGSTEWFRRLYPHRRRQIPLYNPLRNKMPDWLPGPGERSEDFLHGDPYAKIPLGEIRLPGAGYALRYPDLEDVAPKDYPVVHRFRILSDIAPYSSQYKMALRQVRAARKRGELSDQEEEIYSRSIQQLRARKQRKQFYEYENLQPYGSVEDGASFESDVLATINRAKATQTGDKGTVASIFGSYWEWLGHGAETASEQLTPLAPGAKLVHMRDAIEDYERTQLYGSDMAFWQHPIEHFVEPFAASMASAFGWKGVPGDVQKLRDLEEYFDIIKYVKYHRLAVAATVEGDTQAAKEFAKQRRQTMFGLNPYSRNPTSAFRALPRRDRDYFQSFIAAETPEERAKVLEMVPENERTLYVAQWQLAYASEVKDAVSKGLISGEMAEQAMEQAEAVEEQAKTAGLPTSEDLRREYLETRLPGESYTDWYRRTKLLARELEGRALPGPDWVGWHPHVDLEDIKLKLVTNMGEDMHDYNLWPSRERAMRYKPYINDAAVQGVQGPVFTEHEIRDRLDTLFHERSLAGNYTSHQVRSLFGKNSVTISIEQDRNEERKALLKGHMNA